jgi:serine/threonine protein kinase
MAMNFIKGIFSAKTEEKPPEEKKEKLTRDDFEDLTPLGRGSFAKVVLSRNKKNNQLYALKIVEKQTILQQHRERDAFIERNIMRRVENPFILKLHATFQTEHKLFFVMDYMGGGDFDKYLNAQANKAVDYDTARLYAAETYLALKCLHDANIIYRDLKPENILMSRDGHIVLADFGLSKDFGEQGSPDGPNLAQSFVGSPYYVSPDVLRQQKYDKSVDFWSFGILIYRMLYGCTPFVGSTMKQVFDAILTQPVQFPPAGVENDAIAKDLILRLLERDPAKRLKSAEIEAHPYWKAGLGWAEMPLASVLAMQVAPKRWVPPAAAATAPAPTGTPGPAPVPVATSEASKAAATAATHTAPGAPALTTGQQGNFVKFTAGQE